MERRLLDLTGESAHLKKARGSLRVVTGACGERRDIAVPFDEIEAVIVHAREVSYSNEALLSLAEAGIPVVLCDQAHRPRAWLWPAEGNFEQARRMAAQIDCAKPLKKRLWAALVRSKIEQQAKVIEGLGLKAGPLRDMARDVRSGDTGNLEALAAARYWKLLMGPVFRRDPRLGGVNALLNYGYTVLRASAARAVMAAGLHPSIGLHHHNRFNAFCLADDVMEPFRPQVDAVVIALRREGVEEVTPEAKGRLVVAMSRELELDDGFSPVSRCVERLATSLAKCLLDKTVNPELPKPTSFFRAGAKNGTPTL